LTSSAEPGRDWNRAGLGELVTHIVGRHHDYLKQELPALEAAMQNLVAQHGPKWPLPPPR
jgi:regulator of cell morphogenesis and NO signaling